MLDIIRSALEISTDFRQRDKLTVSPVLLPSFYAKLS